MSSVCLVVPCYNEAHRLKAGRWLAFLEAHEEVSLCFVDDGSSDGTRNLLEELRGRRPAQVRVVALPANGGKAAAVRVGVLQCASTQAAALLGYWDADLSTPLEEVELLTSALETDTQCQIAIGSRVKRLGARIERQAMRHVLGRVFATCASWILDFPVYDSQCGAKLFRADIVEPIFSEPFLTRWLFDLELLARLRNLRGRAAFEVSTCEVPLRRWRDISGSKLKLTDILAVPRELLELRRRYNRQR